MDIVFGLGEPTPSVAKWLGKSSGYATTFIGINHPDAKGGVASTRTRGATRTSTSST